MLPLTAYSFGRVTLGGQTLTRDLILFEDEFLSPWIREEGHRLQIVDLQWALDRRPDLLIVGTGAFGALRVPQEVTDALGGKGIELLSFKTEEAIGAYNHRAEQGDRVACCLHLTC